MPSRAESEREKKNINKMHRARLIAAFGIVFDSNANHLIYCAHTRKVGRPADRTEAAEKVEGKADDG